MVDSLRHFENHFVVVPEDITCSVMYGLTTSRIFSSFSLKYDILTISDKKNKTPTLSQRVT